MTKEKEVDSRLFDRRTLERKIKGGAISAKEVEKHMKSLPDVANKISQSPSDDER